MLPITPLDDIIIFSTPGSPRITMLRLPEILMSGDWQLVEMILFIHENRI